MKTDTDSNPCTTGTCNNHGSCFSDDMEKTQCFCETGFEGAYCEIDTRTTTTTLTTTTTTREYGKFTELK